MDIHNVDSEEDIEYKIKLEMFFAIMFSFLLVNDSVETLPLAKKKIKRVV